MNTIPMSTERPEAPLFSDGIGDRVVAADGATGELLQILRIRQTLSAVPSFEFALRERTARLANFRHAYYARVRRVDRVQSPAPGLAIVSDHVEGTRLSDILRVAEERSLQLDINTALCLIRQLVPAVALLHENARDVAHGLIAPERLIVTPHARLVIVEHVLAAAIEQLQFGRERLWQEFRIAMPPSAGLSRFDHRADVSGLGLVALALLLGRPLQADEYPHKLPALLQQARERTSIGEERPLSVPLRDWLARSLQLDPRRAFASAPEALSALEDVVSEDSAYVAAPVALETFLSRYIAALLEPPPVAEAPAATIPFVSPRPAQSAPAASGQPAPPAPGVSRPVPRPAERGGMPQPAPMVPAAPVVPPAPTAASAPPGPPATSWPSADQIREILQAEPPRPPQHAAPRQPPPPPALQSARDITDLISADDLSASLDSPLRAPVGTGAPGATEPPPRTSLFDGDPPFNMVDGPDSVEARPRRGLSKRLVIAAAAVLILGAAGFVAPRFFTTDAVPTPAPEMGTLVVQSNPAGVQVFVDGVDRGLTPATISVTPGAHILELRGRGVPRVIPFNATAGAQVSHYLEFANTPETGQLRVDSQPEGTKVSVDGVLRGVAPLTVTDLVPGDHEVLLQNGDASARHVVNVQAGGIAPVVAPLGAPAAPPAAAGPVSGWVSVKAPFTLEVRDGGRVVGTTDADRIMLAAGRHELQLANEALGYTVSRVVNVPAGKVASIAVELPNGTVHLNALPWAEVWIDGQRVGETPIGNLSVPIGPHEIVFRHPQFGEKRHAISVTLSGPVRLSVDMK